MTHFISLPQEAILLEVLLLWVLMRIVLAPTAAQRECLNALIDSQCPSLWRTLHKSQRGPCFFVADGEYLHVNVQNLQ